MDKKRLKWTRQDNLDVVRSYLIATSGGGSRVYGDRMLEVWRGLRPDRAITKQHLMDQYRFITRSGKISSVEMEALREQLQQEGLIQQDGEASSSDTMVDHHGDVHGRVGISVEPGAAPSIDLFASATTASETLSLQPPVGSCGSAYISDGAVWSASITSSNDIPSGADLQASVTASGSDEDAPRGSVLTLDDGDPVEPDEVFMKLEALFAQVRDGAVDQRKSIKVPREVPKKKLSAATGKVNRAMGRLIGGFVSPDDRTLEVLDCVVYAGAELVMELIGCRLSTGNTNEEVRSNTLPKAPWRLRMEKKIASVRADVSRLTSYLSSNTLTDDNIQGHRVHRIYGVVTVQQARDILGLRKLELEAAAARLRRLNLENKRRKENSLFETNQRQFYRQLSRPTVEVNSDECALSVDQTEDFWSSILEDPVPLQEGDWLRSFHRAYDHIEEQCDVWLSLEDLRDSLKKAHNWKTPGRDRIHTYWWKKFTSIHSPLLLAFQRILDGIAVPPSWFTFGVTSLIPKKGDLTKPNNYRPITCLPTVYKVFTSLIAKAMWRHIDNNDLMPPEQTGCTPRRGGCTDQLLIDQMVLDDSRRHQRNVSTCWIDFKKAYDSLSHEWLLRMLQIFKFGDNLVTCLSGLMGHWRTEMRIPTNDGITASRPISIQRGIFQGDSLSPLIFCLALSPITFHLNNTPGGYEYKQGSLHVTINHLWYMDDLKLMSRGDDALASSVSTVEIIGAKMGLLFNPNKSNWISLEHGRLREQPQEGLQTVLGNVIRHLEPGSEYRYLGVAESSHFHSDAMKSNLKQEFDKRLKQICESQLNACQLIQAINAYVVPVILYSLPIVGWTKADIAQLDRNVRTTLTKHHARHPQSSVRRMYLPRSQGGRGLLSIDHLLRRTVIRLASYLERSNIPMLRAVKHHHDNVLPSTKSITKRAAEFAENLSLPADEVANSDKVKATIILGVRTGLLDMALHGQYWRRIERAGLSIDLSCRWLKSRSLRPATEGFLMAVQDQVIATRNYRKSVLQEDVEDVCRLCSAPVENVDHVVSCCETLARTLYNIRHDNIVRLIHWAICRRFGLSTSREPWRHKLTHYQENTDVQLYWEMSIPTDIRVPHNRPDIVLRTGSTAQLVDVSVPLDHRVPAKMQEKKNKYQELGVELKKIWSLESVVVVPIVVGALGGLSTDAVSEMKNLCGGHIMPDKIQQAAILGTLRVVRFFLGVD